MKTRLIALHGFTQNGAVLRASLEPLLPEIEPEVDLDCPDAPHACSEETVERMQRAWGLDRLAPPHLYWWNATDDGRVYRGWDESRAQIAALASEGPFGLLGFSQGAGVAAALAALAAHGQFPVPRFVALIAGRTPRSDDLKPLFAQPLRVPSLHVWGERDHLAKATAPLMMEQFAAEDREAIAWPGPHTVPTRGEAAAAIVKFVQRHA